MGTGGALLLVQRPLTHITSFNNILVAVDGSVAASRGLHYSIGLADALSARLTIISVANKVPLFAGNAGAGLSALKQACIDEAGDRLCAARALVPDSMPVTTVLRYGSPRKQIHAVAREQRCDLVVMGSRRQGRLSSLFGGLVGDVQFHSSLPMLVITSADDHDAWAGT